MATFITSLSEVELKAHIKDSIRELFAEQGTLLNCNSTPQYPARMDVTEATMLKNKLSDNNIEGVLAYLSLIGENDIINDILIVKQRYIDYKKQSQLGTISLKEFMIEKTRITQTLFVFIDAIKQK
jgi:Effector-associated domain 11